MKLDHIFVVQGTKKGFCFIRTDHKAKVLGAYTGEGNFNYGTMEDMILDKRYDSTFVEVSSGGKSVLSALATHQVNILHLAWPLCYNDYVSKGSFDSLAKHFGIAPPEKQNVADECQALVQTYWAMMRRYSSSLMGEEVVREIGGSLLDKARGFFGV